MLLAPRAPSRAVGSLTASAHPAPGLVVFAGVPVLAAAGGGFATATWCLAALFALALLVVAVTASGPALMARVGAWRAALIAYGAFCAWNYLSILWADVPADAWDGANRTLLYGLVLVLVGLRPWRAGTAIVALATVAFGVGAVALWVLVRSSTGDPGPMFLEGRLAAPTGYANATACLWLIAFWPALHLASGSERTLSRPLRAAGLATAALLLEIALLSQSRGAVGGFAVAALTYLLLTPDRARAALRLGVLIALLAAAWAPLTAVREAATTTGIAETLRDARIAIALSVLVAFAAGAAAATVEDRLLRASSLRGAGRRRSPTRVALAGRGSAVAAALAVIAGVAAVGHPVDWTADRWRDFKASGYRDLGPGQTRFSGSLGSNRYDFYRVALDEFRAHPALGIGSDNFAVAYLENRRSAEAPRYPHSLALRLLAQLGAPGAALFAAFLAFASAAVLRRRRATPVGRGIVAASLAGFAMWLAHGMVDWLWEFPALTVAAVALLGLAASAAAAHAPARAVRRTSWGRRAGPALGALAVLAAAVSFALPGSAARAVAAAGESASLNPRLAIAQLHRAARLNPLSARPLVAAAIIARRAGLLDVGRAAVVEAVRREPRNWFAHLELAMLEAERGRRAAALDSLSTAAALNPRQPVVAMLGERIRRGEPVDAAEVEVALTRQLSSKLRPVAPRKP